MLFSGVYELWPDPLIVSCLGPELLELAFAIPHEADVLYHPTWLITTRNLPRLFRYRLGASQHRKRVHVLPSADREATLLRPLGFRGVLVNISAYISEQDYTITGEAKQYDAIYAGRMVDYKRLWLASGVKNLYVQTYGERRTPSGEYDLHGFEPRIAHCDFNRGWVSTEDIARAYNRARVGLALSKREGAMLASVEYMLCGLPLVSTPCEGGREQFFDARYVEVVDPTPEAVAAGVTRLMARHIDPAFIRGETLRKVTSHRDRLADYVISIIASRGRTPPARAAVVDHLFGQQRGILQRFVHRRDFAKRGW